MNDQLARSLKRDKVSDELLPTHRHDVGMTSKKTEAQSMADFFQEIGVVQGEETKCKQLLLQIKKGNEESKGIHKAEPLQALRKQTDANIMAVTKSTRFMKTKLIELDSANLKHRQVKGCEEGTAIDRQRMELTANQRKKLKELMDEFLSLRSTMGDEIDASIGWPVNQKEMSTSSVPPKGPLKRWRSLFRFHPLKEVPKAEAAIKRCIERVHGSAQFWSYCSARPDRFVNRHQFDYLFQWVRLTGTTLAALQRSPLLSDSTIPVLDELHRILLTADTLTRRSYITGTNIQWLRAAVEQGDSKETFSHLLYNIHWCTNILQCILLENSEESPVQFDPTLCDLSLSVSEELALMTAMKMDEQELRGRIMSIVQEIEFTEPKLGTFASGLLAKLESYSPNLVVLNEEDIDLEGEVIGKGAYGVVRRSKFLDGECVVKTVGLTSYEKEMEAITKLGNHPHIVRHFCCSKTDPEHGVYLVMERLEMDLEKALMSRRKQPLPLWEAVSLMLQIGEGIKFMHGKKVAHRDLKPSNVLINFEYKGSSRICSVKIADFGSTKAAERTETNTMNTGTIRYMAPEVMKVKGDLEKSRLNLLQADVYSFAMMSIHILTGKYPYEYSNQEIKERSKARERPVLRDKLPNLPLRLACLLTKCWSHDPHERPPFTEICRELRYIKGLLLKGDEQKLQTEIPGQGLLNSLRSIKVEGPWGDPNPKEQFFGWGTSIEKIELGYSNLRLERLFEVTYKVSGRTIVNSYLKCDQAHVVNDSNYISTKIEFQSGEFIKQIALYVLNDVANNSYWHHSSWTITSLTIYTNFKIYGPFGEERGTKYTNDTGLRVIGFHGEGGRYLHCLGVVTIPDV